MKKRVTAFAPGRVNLIGEHTDYNEGLGLPFAIERGVTVTATALEGDSFEAFARDLGEHDRFEAAAPPPAAGWRAYARGVAAELRAEGLLLRPARLEIAGTIERGSGLSSSAALEVALCLAMLGLAGAAGDVDRLRLARLCSRVENEWVGARTGVLDQLASLCGRAEHALLIDFRSLAVEPVPLRASGWTFVTVDSGERHSHAGSGYNERREQCAAACKALGARSLREVEAGDLDRLPEPLRRRARHVLEENRRVEQAVAALRAHDLGEVARLLDASHASLRDLYEASTPAVERTVAELRAAGAAGARMVGGGFGGHVLGLLALGVAPPPGATVVTPSDGARLLDS